MAIMIPSTPSRRQVVETELKRIWDERGRLMPDEVVEVASRADHPLHRYFEWDDSKAAHGFRVQQAAGLIRSVKITIVNATATEVEEYKVRAWLPARAAGNCDSTPGGYIPVESASERPEVKDALIRQMLRDIAAFRKRYEHLMEFWDYLGQLLEQRPA